MTVTSQALLAVLMSTQAGFPNAGDPVRSYAAPRASEPVAVDGRLEEAVWHAAPWSDAFVDIRGEGFPAPSWRTRMKIAWDDCYLYVAAELEEPHLWATLTERDAIIYHDHDFEVFLDPDGDGLGYFELEINALGTEFDLFLDRPYSQGGQADIAWNLPGLRTAVVLSGTLNDPRDVDRGWTVEMAIPWRDLRPPGQGRGPGPPSPGSEWRVNFSRVQWPLHIDASGYRKAVEPTPEDPHPEHNWVWSPQGEIDMHLPEHWGRVRFVGPAAGVGTARGTTRPPPRRSP